MTGLMKQPVARTSKRTIWPVLCEVILLNLIFGIALNALPALQTQATPDYVTYEVQQGLASDQVPAEVRQYRDTAVRVLAEHAGTQSIGASFGRGLGVVTGVVFGLLLLSAVNTAIMAMVSVLYALGQDRELPGSLTRLNSTGVPWVSLIIAGLAPALVLPFTSDPKALGELYAIGVVGAIAINVLCCAANRNLAIRPWERNGLWALGAVMSAIEATIIIAKPHATLFAGSIITAVLIARFFMRSGRAKAELPVPEKGWLAEIHSIITKPEGSGPRIMLAARGRDNAEFAVDLARKRGASLFVIYVRTLRLLDVQPGQLPQLSGDPQAQESLGTAVVLAKQAGVPVVPIYVTSPNVAEEILDYTVTYGCDTLILGKSRRSVFSRSVTGDVVSQVASSLPDSVALITRSTSVPTHSIEPPSPQPGAH
jgi:nucleotide-binding universal stress UspA family protein